MSNDALTPWPSTVWFGRSKSSAVPGFRIEEAFGWIKTVAGQTKTRFRGTARVGFAFTFAAAAYNLVRLPKLLAGAG